MKFMVRAAVRRKGLSGVHDLTVEAWPHGREAVPVVDTKQTGRWRSRRHPYRCPRRQHSP